MRVPRGGWMAEGGAGDVFEAITLRKGLEGIREEDGGGGRGS
jgi:hypothetical protein